DQCNHEVNTTERSVHHAAEHLREPVVGRAEYAEDGSYTHDQVEVPAHDVAVMQRNVEDWLSEERAAEATGDEERNKADGEQHGRGESDSSFMEGAEPVECFDG